MDIEYFCFKLVKVFSPVCLRTCVFSVKACVVGDDDGDVVEPISISLSTLKAIYSKQPVTSKPRDDADFFFVRFFHNISQCCIVWGNRYSNEQ